jgi:hypothetical protein
MSNAQKSNSHNASQSQNSSSRPLGGEFYTSNDKSSTRHFSADKDRQARVDKWKEELPLLSILELRRMMLTW